MVDLEPWPDEGDGVALLDGCLEERREVDESLSSENAVSK